ncbi:MAG: acyltransferase [Coriobacteriia bacterium]|nr:acyltransferase [Coriobacteriia bacterium]
MPEAERPAPAAGAQRRPGLDVLKGLAILLVVFNHAVLWPMRAGDPASGFAYGVAFGTVAAFSAVAGYLQGRHPAREEYAVLRKRAGQLMVPWLAWAPVYALVPLVWAWAGRGELPIEMRTWPWIREILLGGGPLWFLTGLFAVTAICAFLDTRTTGWWPMWLAWGTYTVLAVGSSLGNVSPLDLGNGTFWAVVPLYVGAYWFGLRISRDGDPGWAEWALWTALVLSMLTSGVVTYVRAADTSLRWLMWLPYAIGCVGGCAALLLAMRDTATGHGPAFQALARVGRSSLGLYVLHPLFVAPVTLFAHGRGGVVVAFAAALATAAIGTPVVEWTRRIPVLRRIV